MICGVDLELTPPQAPEIEQAVAAALDDGPPAPDPWWEAGNREALGT